MMQGRIFAAIAAVAGFVVWVIPVRAQLLPPTDGPQGFYIGGEGGWTDLLTSTNHGNGSVSLEDFKAGYNGGGRFGYQWGRWRFEGEVDYRDNDTQDLHMVSPMKMKGLAGAASRSALSQMANVIYDLDPGLPVIPHIGGGLGAAEVSRNLTNMFGGTHYTTTVFAYQLIAGVRYPLSPSLAVDVDYRYFATADTTFISTNPSKIVSDYASHNLVVSLTWLFGGFPSP